MRLIDRLFDRFRPRPNIEALARKRDIARLSKALRHTDLHTRRHAAIALLSRFSDVLAVRSLDPQPDLREIMALFGNSDWGKFLRALTVMLYLVPDPDDRQALLAEATRLARTTHKQDISFSVDPRDPHRVLLSDTSGDARTGRGETARAKREEPQPKPDPARIKELKGKALDFSDNLTCWRRSGEPWGWVEAHRGCWKEEDFHELIESLKRSQFWPLDPGKAKAVLEELSVRWRQKEQRSKERHTSGTVGAGRPNVAQTKPSHARHQSRAGAGTPDLAALVASLCEYRYGEGITRPEPYYQALDRVVATGETAVPLLLRHLGEGSLVSIALGKIGTSAALEELKSELHGRQDWRRVEAAIRGLGFSRDTGVIKTLAAARGSGFDQSIAEVHSAFNWALTELYKNPTRGSGLQVDRTNPWAQLLMMSKRVLDERRDETKRTAMIQWCEEFTAALPEMTVTVPGYNYSPEDAKSRAWSMLGVITYNLHNPTKNGVEGPCEKTKYCFEQALKLKPGNEYYTSMLKTASEK